MANESDLRKVVREEIDRGVPRASLTNLVTGGESSLASLVSHTHQRTYRNTARLVALEALVAEMAEHDATNPLTADDVTRAVNRALEENLVQVDVTVRGATDAP